MGWLFDLLAYIGSHHIAAIWIAIFLMVAISAMTHSIANQLNQAYKNRLNAEEARLVKLSENLSAREASLSARERSVQEKECQIQQHISSEVYREVSARLSEHPNTEIQFHKLSPSLSRISSLLPKMYSALFAPPYSDDLASRIRSAADGSLSITGALSCRALVRSGSKTYQTSLAHCTCDDFVFRGGPCKHMLHLLFSITETSISVLQEQLCSSKMDMEIQKGYTEQLRIEKRARAQLEQEYKNFQAETCDKITTLQNRICILQDEAKLHKENLELLLDSNLTAIPWLAGMMADFLTYDLEVEAKKLEWGSNIQRQKKVASIRDIRADARARIQEAKEAVYQLEYLRSLYPALDDVLDTDFCQLDFSGKIPEYDPIRNYLSKDEWEKLSPAEKDQLALDRYMESRNKSKWQIGRDYELSVAYEYRQKGYHVDTVGSYMRLEDLGRDLIARDGQKTIIIQCKYWSKTKTIHEKHIFQLYGTVVTYQLEHQNLFHEPAYGVFVTNTVLSPMAHQVADTLGITIVENHEMKDFPRIKCNIGHDESGETHIYHLPMDSQYDSTKIKHPGEFYAYTVQEAIDAGFRRAYKWYCTHS